MNARPQLGPRLSQAGAMNGIGPGLGPAPSSSAWPLPSPQPQQLQQPQPSPLQLQPPGHPTLMHGSGVDHAVAQPDYAGHHGDAWTSSHAHAAPTLGASFDRNIRPISQQHLGHLDALGQGVPPPGGASASGVEGLPVPGYSSAPPYFHPMINTGATGSGTILGSAPPPRWDEPAKGAVDPRHGAGGSKQGGPSREESSAADGKRTANGDGAPQPLRRNQACLSCRKRKLRCDAVRPVCGTCARSKAAAAAANHAAPVPDGDCHYDDPPQPSGENGDQGGESHAPRPGGRRPSEATRRSTETASDSDFDRKRRKTTATMGGPSSADARPWSAPQRPPMAMTDPTALYTPTATKPFAPPLSAGSAASFYAMAQPPTSEAQRVQLLESRVKQLEKLLHQSQAELSRRSSPVPGSSNDRPGGLIAIPPPEEPLQGRGAVPIFSMLSPFSGKEEKFKFFYEQRRAKGAKPTGLSTSTTGPADRPATTPASASGSSTQQAAAARSEQGSDATSPVSRSNVPVASVPAGSSQSPSFGAVQEDADVKAEVTNPEMLELLWYGWPSDLPPMDVMVSLAEIFFAKHPLRSLIYRPSFMVGIVLPPGNPNRPHDALLHAMCAAVADFSPHLAARGSTFAMDSSLSMADSLEPSLLALPSLRGHDVHNMSFKDYHLSKAKNKVERALLTSGLNPLDWLQAIVLVCNSLWADQRIVETYFCCGFLGRILPPSGLAKLITRHDAERPPTGLLAHPESATEEHERRMVLWWIYIMDFYCIGPSRMAEPILDDGAIQTALPIPVKDFQAGRDPELTGQTLASPDLFSAHHIDNFTLHIKATVIAKRVMVWVCRSHCYVTRRKAPGIKKLDTCLIEFGASMPPLDLWEELDPDAVAAHATYNLAIIRLHEHFLDSSTERADCYSNQRIKEATDSVLNCLHQLCATSYDFGLLLHPNVYLAWAVTGRMITKEVEWKRLHGEDEAEITLAENALDVLVMALRRAGDKCLKAKRYGELLFNVRIGTITEIMLDELLTIDGVIPVGELGDMASAGQANGMAPSTSNIAELVELELAGTSTGANQGGAEVTSAAAFDGVADTTAASAPPTTTASTATTTTTTTLASPALPDGATQPSAHSNGNVDHIVSSATEGSTPSRGVISSAAATPTAMTRSNTKGHISVKGGDGADEAQPWASDMEAIMMWDLPT